MVSQLSTQLDRPLGARDHVRGPRSASVSLVEYGDFECPYCRASISIVNGLQQALGDELSFTFRHFPMRPVHPHAQHAAEVAEGAATQGHFWDMHDRLFAGQDALDDESLVGYARELDLDAEELLYGLVNRTYASRVEEDRQSGLAIGVTSTPAFFIDRRRFDGSISLPKMLVAIRQLHPDLRVWEPSATARRIPRVRWPHE